MPWDTQDTMSLREEFVRLAIQEGANRREFVPAFRHQSADRLQMADAVCKRRDWRIAPAARNASPAQTPADVQAAVVELRLAHPAWGGRKISRRLQDRGASQCRSKYGQQHPASPRADSSAG